MERTMLCRKAAKDVMELKQLMLLFDQRRKQVEEIVGSAQRRYSVVVGRDAWYELRCQYPMEPDFAAELPSIHVDSYPVLVAMRQDPALSKLVAHRLCAGDDLLYVCVHNPMTDLHIIELKELLTKADRGIVLVVVLPALEEFDQALLNPMTNRRVLL